MKTNFKLLCVMLLIALWVVAGCTSSGSQVAPTAAPTQEAAELPTEPPTAVPDPTAIPETTVDPAAAVVLEMVARANSENYAGAADLVADDMMAYFIGMPPTGMEIYWGKEQFQTFLEECCTGQHFLWEVVPERVEDRVVYAQSKTWMDFTRELGVAPNSWYEMFVVEDGKITLYISTITEKALAKFKPVIFEAIPELATAVQPPTESDETPVSEVTITIANNTCAYDGPMTLQAGELTVNVELQDQGWDKYAVSFFTLDEGKDMIDLMASTYNPGRPSWSNMVFLEELVPGENQTYQSFAIEEGLLYMVCWAGIPDTAVGNAGPFVVKTSSPEATVDLATAVVLDYAARVNAGDYAGAAKLFADDAMAYLIGMPPTGMEIYWGKEQYRTFLEECCTGQHFEMEVTPVRVEGGVVYAEAKTWMDFTRDLGVAPNSFHEMFVVADGKISLYVSTMTEDALANFKPVLYEAIPELATAVQPPVASDETSVSEVAVTITNSTCAYSGPMTFQEGELIVNVDIQDQRFDKYAVTFFTLDEGKDLIDLMASTHNPGPPSWSDMVFYRELGPGESETYRNFLAKEGLLYMVCWGGPPDIAIGNAGPFVVQK